MTLDLYSGHRITAKLKLVQLFCGKVASRNLTLAMVDCVKEMTSKKICKYGEYGSCEYLILFVVCLSFCDDGY